MKIPINIWSDLERVWVQRLDIVYEGSRISGIHHSGFEDVVSDLDRLIRKLSKYRDEMAFYYGEKMKKYNTDFFSNIYLIGDNKGLTKIGRSVDVNRRLREIQKMNPFVELIYVSPVCENKIEKELHHKYREYRVHGEWFDLSHDQILEIKNHNYNGLN